MLNKVNSKMGTPERDNFNTFFDKNAVTLFKKKKAPSSQVSSYKNTIAKKIKKQSFNNSNSSLKKGKSSKPQKEFNPSRFIIENIKFSNMKPKC